MPQSRTPVHISVLDPEDDFLSALIEASKRPPGDLERAVPVWGPVRGAVADLHEGDVGGAILNGAVALSDLNLASMIRKGLIMGVLVNTHKRTGQRLKPDFKNASPRLKDREWVRKGEHGHHAIIPQGGIGKMLWPEVVNHPLNIKSLPPAQHMRIHKPHGGLPRYNIIQRTVVGAPAWTRPATTSTVGRPAVNAYEEDRERKQRR